MVRATLALLVFALDFWALTQLFGSGAARGRKLRWAAIIVFLPVVGFVLWLRKGPRPSERARQTI